MADAVANEPLRLAHAAASLLMASFIGITSPACQRPASLACESGSLLCPALASLSGAAPQTHELRVGAAASLIEEDGASRYHLQGVQRLAGGGFAVSGNAPRGSYFFTTDAAGDLLDFVVLDERFAHAGGFQVDRGLLAIGVEKQGERDGGSRVFVFDLADPSAPRRLAHLTIAREPLSAGAVALLHDEQGLLLAVGSWDCEQIDFHRLHGDPHDAQARWRPAGSWRVEHDGLAPTSMASDWPSYQSLSLLRLADGSLVLAGLYGTTVVATGNHADFHELALDDGAKPALRRIARLSLPQPEGGHSFHKAGGLTFQASPLRVGALTCAAQVREGRVRCTTWP